MDWKKLLKRDLKDKKNKNKPTIEHSINQEDSATDSINNELNHGVIQCIEDAFRDTDDLVKQEIVINNKKMTYLYLHPLVDEERMQQTIICLYKEVNFEDKVEHWLCDENFSSTNKLQEVLDNLLDGQCVITYEECAQVFILKAQASHFREVQEPNNEQIVRGSHHGFVESLSINLFLLRNGIKNPNLSIKQQTVGKQSKTPYAIVYMQNIANQTLVQQVQDEMSSIQLDSVLSTGMIEEFLEDHKFSLYPQLLRTERIDRTIASLMEGKIVIILDNTPDVLILPATFFSFFQSPDDYNSRWILGSFFRMIRILSFVIATTLPAVYIAVISFHSEVIPRKLILLAKEAVQQIPYPPIVEALLVEIIIELLREASVRLPKPIGQTIGIVGGLVIGDAIVRAGLVSNIMIIIVALTAIASFVIPNHEMSASIRLTRFPLMLVASTLGFIGIAFGFMLIVIHLCRLTSLGMPYLSPLAPFRWKDIKDSFIRLPIWTMITRPKDALPINKRKLSTFKEWGDGD